MLTPTARRSHASYAAACGLLLTLGLTGCGGGDESADEPEDAPTAALPTGDVEVPEGIDLTPAGTELDFGETATVAYQAGQDTGSVVQLTVVGAKAGRVRDLAAFQLDETTRAATPYYVRVKVTNVGAEDLGGAAVPLFAVDGRDTLVQPSTFTTSFERCPSTPLPAQFAPDAEVTTCLVYLLPDQGTLEAVSYRPLQDFAPITWTGETP